MKVQCPAKDNGQIFVAQCADLSEMRRRYSFDPTILLEK